MSLSLLPDAPLDGRDGISARFRQLGIGDYRSAARHVRDLPYGRNTDRSDFRLVLAEGRGTCSTKHALLAALAMEQEIGVRLRIGIYLMDGANTPGVGGVLRRHDITGIPEAHCYLVYRGRRVDVTSPGAVPISDFVTEEDIAPDGIGVHKVAMHRRYVERWAKKNGLDFGRAWTIREECIAALSS